MTKERFIKTCIAMKNSLFYLHEESIREDLKEVAVHDAVLAEKWVVYLLAGVEVRKHLESRMGKS